jgi:hypothetical protein
MSGVLLIGSLVLMSACGNLQRQDISGDNMAGRPLAANDQTAPMRDLSAGQTGNHGKVTKIPSYSGGQTPEDFPLTTTNRHGAASNGLGTNVYSLMGSSSLHPEGLSSYIESRLKSAGVDGIRVLALDDTIILGQSDRQIATTRYDDIQNQVINGRRGTSAKGPWSKNESTGTPGSKGADFNNLDEARHQIRSILGDNVRILTVSDRNAVAAMDRFKSRLNSGPVESAGLADDISIIMKNASPDKEKH